MFFAIGGCESGGMADALDLGSSGQPWGFESPLSHQRFEKLKARPNERKQDKVNDEGYAKSKT